MLWLYAMVDTKKDKNGRNRCGIDFFVPNFQLMKIFRTKNGFNFVSNDFHNDVKTRCFDTSGGGSCHAADKHDE